MSPAPTTERLAAESPRIKARFAGALWLLDAGVAAPFAEFFVRGKLVVYRDAAATANNIVAHERLYRLGASAWLIALTCATAVALLLYDLLRPVSKSLSLLVAFFRLMFVAVMAVNSLNYFAPLLFLGNSPYMVVFKPDQLQALTLASHNFFNIGYDISMVFWGFHIVLIATSFSARPSFLEFWVCYLRSGACVT